MVKLFGIPWVTAPCLASIRCLGEACAGDLEELGTVKTVKTQRHPGFHVKTAVHGCSVMLIPSQKIFIKFLNSPGSTCWK